MITYNKCLIFLAFCFVFLFSTASHAAEQNKIIFCESLSENLECNNPLRKSPQMSVSWVVNLEKAFATPEILFSLYEVQSMEETLVEREHVSVNPAWNVFAIKNFHFPKTGNFHLVLTTNEGTEIASGAILIEDSVEEQVVKPEETMGKTLETLFNQYKNQ